MTTILPQDKVVHITNQEGARYGYGLQLAPDAGGIIQHWILFSEAPPAKAPGEAVFLPSDTTWTVTNDLQWRDAKTKEKFLAQVCAEINLGGTIYYATAKLVESLVQPDVGGFQLFQRGIRVGEGSVTWSAEEGYRETWYLDAGFSADEGFGFRFVPRYGRPVRRHRGGQVQDPDCRGEDRAAAIPTDAAGVVLALTYYKNEVPRD